jgi:hypothetical protein
MNLSIATAILYNVNSLQEDLKEKWSPLEMGEPNGKTERIPKVLWAWDPME